MKSDLSFIRYVIVQVFAYVLDFGLFWLLIHNTACNAFEANTAGKIIAIIFAFFAHRTFTFGVAKNEEIGHSAIKYLGVFIINCIFSNLILALLMTLTIDTEISKIISDICGVLITFTLSKKYVFISHQRAS